MRTRGYPVDDFDRRADDISVEHPKVVQHYRDARATRVATDEGEVDTERQRQAVTSYRALIEALLHGESHQDTPLPLRPRSAPDDHRAPGRPAPRRRLPRGRQRALRTERADRATRASSTRSTATRHDATATSAPQTPSRSRTRHGTRTATRPQSRSRARRDPGSTTRPGRRRPGAPTQATRLRQAPRSRHRRRAGHGDPLADDAAGRETTARRRLVDDARQATPARRRTHSQGEPVTQEQHLGEARDSARWRGARRHRRAGARAPGRRPHRAGPGPARWRAARRRRQARGPTPTSPRARPS